MVEEAYTAVEEVRSGAALAAMFAVMAEDPRTVVDFAGAGLTFDADRQEKPARAARPLDTELVSVVPGKEVEEGSRERSLDAAPADAPVEELGVVEARCRI